MPRILVKTFIISTVQIVKSSKSIIHRNIFFPSTVVSAYKSAWTTLVLVILLPHAQTADPWVEPCQGINPADITPSARPTLLPPMDFLEVAADIRIKVDSLLSQIRELKDKYVSDKYSLSATCTFQR